MRFAILVCLLASASCAGDLTGSATTLTGDGKWNATLVTSATKAGSGVMALTLSQNGTTVAGIGTFTDPTDPPAGIFTVSGSVNGSSVALTLLQQPQQYMGKTIDANQAPVQFAGTLTATTMDGTLNGGGPPAVIALPAHFTKQ